MILPSAKTRVNVGHWGFKSGAEDLRFSLRLWYARFDTFDLCSTKTSGGTLMLGTRDTLRPNGTLEVGGGDRCGQSSLVSFGRHGRCVSDRIGSVVRRKGRMKADL